MKRFLILTLTILILAVPVICAAKDKFYDNINGVEFVKNYDGDTITINIEGYPDILGKKISVRLRGIDTPEIKGKCQKEKDAAHNAKAIVNHILINAGAIDLVQVSRGKYFRLVADVIVDGVSISESLLKYGSAVRYDGGTKSKDWCE